MNCELNKKAQNDDARAVKRQEEADSLLFSMLRIFSISNAYSARQSTPSISLTISWAERPSNQVVVEPRDAVLWLGNFLPYGDLA